MLGTENYSSTLFWGYSILGALKWDPYLSDNSTNPGSTNNSIHRPGIYSKWPSNCSGNIRKGTGTLHIRVLNPQDDPISIQEGKNLTTASDIWP